MTGHIELREVEDADLPIFFAHQRDPLATAMASFQSREREAFMAHWAKILRDPKVPIRTILEAGKVAGYVSCFPEHERELIGYWLGREFWGRGVATAALSQFLELIDARPLFAIVAKHNHASIRVLEKAGFSHCGLAPGSSGGEAELLLVL